MAEYRKPKAMDMHGNVVDGAEVVPMGLCAASGGIATENKCESSGGDAIMGCITSGYTAKLGECKQAGTTARGVCMSSGGTVSG